jgi:hypothetical protein
VKPSQLKRRNRRRDDRARPERPVTPGPDVFDWAPWIEPVFGPTPKRPAVWLPPLAAEPTAPASQEAAS